MTNLRTADLQLLGLRAGALEILRVVKDVSALSSFKRVVTQCELDVRCAKTLNDVQQIVDNLFNLTIAMSEDKLITTRGRKELQALVACRDALQRLHGSSEQEAEEEESEGLKLYRQAVAEDDERSRM